MSSSVFWSFSTLNGSNSFSKAYISSCCVFDRDLFLALFLSFFCGFWISLSNFFFFYSKRIIDFYEFHKSRTVFTYLRIIDAAMLFFETSWTEISFVHISLIFWICFSLIFLTSSFFKLYMKALKLFISFFELSHPVFWSNNTQTQSNTYTQQNGGQAKLLRDKVSLAVKPSREAERVIKFLCW